MRPTTSLFVLALFGVILPGCRAAEEGPRPEDVPRERALHPVSMDVLQVTFEATPAGYSVVEVGRAFGAPTLALTTNRDVLVTARDASGQAIGSVSVDNPRQVTTAGSKDPATAVLDSARFTVNFAGPDAIRSIDLVVRRGPNEKLSRSFPIEAKDD